MLYFDLSTLLRFHFDSLAHDNAAAISTVDTITVIPNDRGDNTPSPIVLFGTQLVAKFNQPTPGEVHILMAVFRVEEKHIDLIVTFNVPTHGSGVGPEGLQVARTHFNTFITSLRIIDFSLFA